MKYSHIDVNIKFFRDAEELYRDGGPAAATSGAAGFDLRAVLPARPGGEPGSGEISIPPGGREQIRTGIAIEPMQPGVAAFVYSRSGLGAVKGLTVAQGTGIIDPDYRGEILVYLLNTGQEARSVKHGDRIAQMVFQPYFQPRFNPVQELGETGRGAGGFGHTGSS